MRDGEDLLLTQEVRLKAFTIARNPGARPHDSTTVNMDMIAHCWPGQTRVIRPPQVGGRGHALRAGTSS